MIVKRVLRLIQFLVFSLTLAHCTNLSKAWAANFSILIRWSLSAVSFLCNDNNVARRFHRNYMIKESICIYSSQMLKDNSIEATRSDHLPASRRILRLEHKVQMPLLCCHSRLLQMLVLTNIWLSRYLTEKYRQINVVNARAAQKYIYIFFQ